MNEEVIKILAIVLCGAQISSENVVEFWTVDVDIIWIDISAPSVGNAPVGFIGVVVFAVFKFQLQMSALPVSVLNV